MTKLTLLGSSLFETWSANWPTALRIWNGFIKLREPVWCKKSSQAKAEGLEESFAMIRLTDHRIVIDLEQIDKAGVGDFSLQILAHEIGHHVFVPANLDDHGRMLARMRWGLTGIEDRAPFVSNIYADLLINDRLHRTKSLDMAAVFQQLNKGIKFSEVWLFIMRTYEYLWRLNRGHLASDLKMHSAKIDADASLAASLLRSYSKDWLSGAGRYAALMYPYLVEEAQFQEARSSMSKQLDAEKAGVGGELAGGLTAIEDSKDEAVDPRTEAAETATMVEGEEQGTENGIKKDSAKSKQNKKGAHKPGEGQSKYGGTGPEQRYLEPGQYVDLGKQVNANISEQELLNNYYREIALPHLVSFPVDVARSTELSLPEGLDTWDLSDPMEEVDWLESVIASPQLFSEYGMRKRVYGPDDNPIFSKKPLDVYIGIDCSGSMKNPRYNFSWPVLAATVIGLSALRAGVKVMGCLSGEPGSFLETKGFSSSEQEILTVLTSYLGTGYAYGIPRLEKPFLNKLPNASHIVIVTDDDIFSMLGADNGNGKSNWAVIKSALENAGGSGTLVLHSQPNYHPKEVEALREMGWRIAYVTNEAQLLQFAAAFSRKNYSMNTAV